LFFPLARKTFDDQAFEGKGTSRPQASNISVSAGFQWLFSKINPIGEIALD